MIQASSGIEANHIDAGGKQSTSARKLPLQGDIES